MMKRFLFLLFICGIFIKSNDGSFYFEGNQLIPITESDISVQKEILSLERVRNELIEVTVYYEFYNPGAEKEVIVGFEAIQPDGDVDDRVKNGGHPYMYDFTVNLNNTILSYDIAYVDNDAYLKTHKIEGKKLEDYDNPSDFYYVYYFKAKFKKGVNIIKHTYYYKISASVDFYYDFSYVLTAANRWANNQIDDFTLIIDVGDFQDFNISKSFYQNNSDWLINGFGKMKSVNQFNDDTTEFYIQKGNVIFQKKNFHPEGELFVFSKNYFKTYNELPFSYEIQNRIPEPRTDFEKRVYKNLPFARRGYVFKNEELKKYFQEQQWYLPNPNYTPDLELLDETERNWIKKYE